MTERDDFLERLRADARPLRYEPDEFALARIRARIRATIERPTVTEMLAAWFRPVLAAVALVASIALFTLTETANDEPALGDEPPEIVMAGDSYRVGD